MPRNGGLNFEFEAQPRGYRSAPRAVTAALALPALPYLRASQRHPVPPDRRRRWWLLALVLVGHLLLAWLVYLVLRPAIDQRVVGNAIAITLIEPTAGLPPAPPLVAPPPLQQGPAPPPPRRVPYVPPAKGAIQAQMQGVKSPPLELYGVNGTVRLPPTSAPPVPAYRTPELKASHIASGKSPIPYKPTRFSNVWAPVNQTLGGEVLEKVIDKTTIKKTVKVPVIGRVHCAVNPLLILAGGIGCSPEAPPPRPDNDDDIRLSMPPPETLTGKKVVLPASAASAAPAASH